MNFKQALTVAAHPIASIRKAAQALTLQDASGWRYLSGGSTYTGRPVNEDIIFQITAVWSAIRLISETIGTLPVHLYQKTDDGRVVAKDHRLYRKIHARPSKYVTAPTFYESLAASLAVVNQGYILAPRVGSIVESMTVLPKRCVTPFSENDMDIKYKVTLGGKERIYEIGEIIPIKGFGAAGMLEGMEVSPLFRNAFALSMAAEEYGSRFFANGARVGGILTIDNVLSKTQREAVRRNFEDLHSGLESSHKLAVLEANMKFQPVTMPNDSAQMLETRKMQIAEIARIFRVPPHMLMEEVGLKYNNYEQGNLSFLTYTMRPYLVRIEAALNCFLLTEQDQKNGYYVEFSVEGLLRGDSKTRSEYYRNMRQIGGITINEIREKENLPKSKARGANDVHVPLNMAPVQNLGETDKRTEGDDNGNKSSSA